MTRAAARRAVSALFRHIGGLSGGEGSIRWTALLVLPGAVEAEALFKIGRGRKTPQRQEGITDNREGNV